MSALRSRSTASVMRSPPEIQLEDLKRKFIFVSGWRVEASRGGWWRLIDAHLVNVLCVRGARAEAEVCSGLAEDLAAHASVARAIMEAAAPVSTNVEPLAS